MMQGAKGHNPRHQLGAKGTFDPNIIVIPDNAVDLYRYVQAVKWLENTFYFPMQNLEKISSARSSPISCPVISPRDSYALMRSMV